MDRQEAIVVCQHWIERCDAQERKAEQLARVAADLRNKKITWEEGQRLKRQIDGFAPTVYDGSSLYKAVKILLSEIDGSRPEGVDL